MHKLIAAAMLAVMLTLGCRGDTDPEIENCVRRFHRAFDAKDLTALRQCATRDMFWYTLNGKALNAAQINDFFTPMLERWETIKTDLREIEIQRRGNLAVARYQSVLAITSNGKATTMQNLHTTVLVKQGGGWLICQHHMSTRY